MSRCLLCGKTAILNENEVCEDCAKLISSNEEKTVVGMNSVGVSNQEVRQFTDKKLWNPNGFFILSILFSFLPAAILYSLNYGRLGFYKRRNISLLVSFILFAVMITIAFLIDQLVLKSVFYCLNIGAGVYMRNDQDKLFKNHILKGGRKASYLVPAIVCTVIVAIFVAVAIYSINIPDQKIMINNSEVYYTDNVQKSDAEELGNYLNKQGFFTEGKEIAVKLDKNSDTYEFSLIVSKSSLEDKDLLQICKHMSTELSKSVFNDAKVDVNLCDDVFKPLKTISND